MKGVDDQKGILIVYLPSAEEIEDLAYVCFIGCWLLPNNNLTDEPLVLFWTMKIRP